MEAKMWEVLDPKTNKVTLRGPQVTRPRENDRAVVVGSFPASDPPPSDRSVAAWDGWRMRRGYSGSHSG